MARGVRPTTPIVEGGPIFRELPHDITQTLFDSDSGRLVVVVRFAEGLADSFRLRELGLVEGSQIIVLKRGDPLLVLVEDTRLAVDCELARGIEVSYAAR